MKFHHHHHPQHHKRQQHKKGEYDIWAMKMEHYLAHTDYPIWEVIQNGNGPVSITTDTQGQIKVLPPRTAEEILARERERKARTTLLMALPEDHLAKFHKMTDAKEMWDAIKSRFGGNDESKKMQKYILKQQFEGFSVSNSEGLHKGYDRFQSLLSQLEIHGAGVSTEDANQKFLRSLPSAWSQVSLIMRTKPGVDSLSFDDLYNNLRVFENDVKGSTASSSSTQNVAFVSENTSSTNDVSTAYNVSTPSGQNSQYEQTSSYSLLANQSSCPQLDHEDLEQLDEYDLEEMDLKWQVAMISMRMKKFYKKTGRKLQFDAKEPVGFDKTKVECYNCHKIGHFARECRTKGNQDSRRRDAWNSGNKDGRRSGKQEDSKALVTIDGEGVDWTSHSEEEEDYALMACNSSGSDTEVTSCSNECKESYAKLKKLYDAQREQLSDASIEIKAYTQGLKKVEAQLVAHQQGQLWYEEKIRFMKIDLDDKTDVLTYHKKLLAEAQKEKEDLKAKVEKWHTSSKNLGKLLNTQMSANDKFGLGYGDHRYDGILSYENEVLQSVFMNKESELEKQPLYDRFVTVGGMHAVPPPMTGNYMPSGPDVEIDYSQFTYGPKQSQPSESDFDTCESDCSVETHESLPEPTVNEPKVVNQPKVWSDAPIIEEYESDSEDEHVSQPTKEQEQPSFASTIVKRMTKQAELNNSMRMKSSQREIRPIWNNVQRVNHQNQFVPTAVLTRTGKIPVNTARASGTKNVSTARHSFNRQAVLTSAAMKVNTVKPIVNRVRPTTVFHKTHSPFSKPFNKTTALRTNFSKQKVNTAKLNAVSAVGGKRETAVKPSAGCNWRPKRHHYWQNDYPHRALQNKGIVDSGCSRHMTGNKAYLAEYQDFNGGPVAFGGSKGYITGKGKIKTGKLDFEDVCFVKELQHFNLFSVSQMCDKKNKVLFTDSEYQEPSNKHACPQEAIKSSMVIEDIIDARDSEKEDESAQDYFVLPIWSSYSSMVKRSIAKDAGDAPNKHLDLKTNGKPVDKEDQEFAQQTKDLLLQAGAAKPSSTNIVNTASTPVSTASTDSDLPNPDQDDSEIPALEEIYKTPTDGIFTNSSYDDEGAVADFTNLETVVNVSPIPTSRINSFHPSTLILGDPQSAVQTRSKVTKSSGAHAFVSYVQKQRRNNHKDFQHCLFVCFLSQNEPKKIYKALEDESWVDDMQEKLLQFKIQKVDSCRFSLCVRKAIGQNVFGENKKDEKELWTGNKQGFIDPKYPQKVYKVVKALYGLHQAPRACTPIETQKPLVKDEEASDVDVHLYRSMIGSLMYLTASRPDIMFAVCACSRFQVTPKTSHLSVVKRIFRYLKGKPKLGLWYPRVSLFNLEAYSDSESNYRSKFLTGKSRSVVNFFGSRLFLGNAKSRPLWLLLLQRQNMLLLPIAVGKFCGFKIKWMLMKELIQVLKIHTDDNVADLLTKAFDVSRFQFLVYAEAFLTIGDEFQEVHWVSRVLGKRYRRYCNIAVAKLVQFFIGTS
ncbi:ribonuclease H-like domain-containing protein [Tanacetum coccineum]